MAWIESHQELSGHPKTKKLARKLGVPVPAVIGHLHLLWWWAMDYAQEGDLSQYEPEDIADAVMWDGPAETFIEALIDTRFLDQDEQGLHIHDWYEYAGRLIEQKKFFSEKKKRNRQLYDNVDLTRKVRARDGDNCRYCGKKVNWKDRKSADGGTYDQIDPEGPNTETNIVVACRGCISAKGRRTPEQANMHLLPAVRYQVDNLPEIYQKSAIPNLTKPNQTEQKEKHTSPTGSLPSDGAQIESGKGNNPPAEKSDAYTAEFEEFWKHYPRRIEKKSAFKAWNARLREREGPDYSILIQAAINYAIYCKNERTDARFIKHPNTFLGPNKPYEDFVDGIPESNSADKKLSPLKQQLLDQFREAGLK